MGITGLVIGFGPAVGPTISGLILKYADWQMLFVILSITSALVFVLGLLTIKNLTDPQLQRTDVLSFGEAMVGFGFFCCIVCQKLAIRAELLGCWRLCLCWA